MLANKRKTVLAFSGVLLLIALISCLVVLFTTGGVDPQDVRSEKTVQIQVRGIDGDYSLYVDKNGATWYSTPESEQMLSGYKRTGVPCVELPDWSTIEGEDTLEFKLPSSELTYNLTRDESFRLVKFWLDGGGTILREAATPQFVEIFMSLDGSVKRIIIFSESVVLATLYEDAELPLVETYFQEYLK